MPLRGLLTFTAIILLCMQVHAETKAEHLLRKSDDWFSTEEGKKAVDNILSWQTEQGDWPKNQDTIGQSFAGKTNAMAGTFDNGATTGELRVLARAFRVTGIEVYRDAFYRGFDHIIRAQYPNGGWPQFFPLSKEYHRHITFNDGTMIRVIELLRDSTTEKDFSFLNHERKETAKTAVQRGIDCILKCQVVVSGKKTVWCAQHHAQTLQPVKARSYELPSLSGAESAGILLFLMSIEKPSPEITSAVNAGAEWFDAVKIEGYRYHKGNSDQTLTKDPNASPLWARFYEIETNRPIFSDRDVVVKYDLNQVGSERRHGYAWYGPWGVNVRKEHAKWMRK